MRYLTFAIFALLFSCGLQPAFAQAPNLNCPANTAAARYTLNGGITADCPSTQGVATPTCVSPQVLQNGVCVTPQTAPTSNPAQCTPQASDVKVQGNALTRQCSGVVSYSGNKFGQKGYNGPMFTLSQVLGGGSWPSYISGYSFTPQISTGSYIALAFTPTASGSIQFTSDPSYGDGGLISLSTVPGQFLSATPGVICSYARGASNSLYIPTTPGSYCGVTAGRTYYVNFADADLSGNAGCWPSNVPNSCSSSPVSYSEIVGH